MTNGERNLDVSSSSSSSVPITNSFLGASTDSSQPHPSQFSNTRKVGRVSRFVEVGIAEQSSLATVTASELSTVPSNKKRPVRRVRFRSRPDYFEPIEDLSDKHQVQRATSLMMDSRSVSLSSTSAPQQITRSKSMSLHLPFTLILIAIVAVLNHFPNQEHSRLPNVGVAAGALPLQKRQDTSTDTCTRWAGQSALVNGTIYFYGGRSKQQARQDSDTWNNDFLSLDVSTSWDIAAPALSGLPRPSGPPEVSLGELWHSYDSLFLYGGQFSENPQEDPTPFSLWEYNIADSRWTEHESPRTSPGNASDGGDTDVQRAAEGAGISIPSLGRGFYFGGHLDFLTTAGWSNTIDRVYLRSMIEYTFPGFSNSGVDSLQGSETAGTDGVWRNITQGGLQDSDGFTERADGVLVYVPGYGDQGTILGLAGGTNRTFTQMNVIDVFDIATSQWYKQTTRGGPPEIRVNPCTVAVSAADGSSTNIYMFGGQNLIPYGEQNQYDDMWILTVPSFTWIEVEAEDVPYARAGHSCEVWDGQMVVIGGYVGEDIGCDSPGIYVFDLSSLKWQTNFRALEGSGDLSQQSSQDDNVNALAGSYGYQVPEIVQDRIGGDGNGGATVTVPAASATAGPFQTGSPILYTVTAGAGPAATAGVSASGESGPNIGAIVGGVLAGVFFLLACYLGFCAYIYRRQLILYKNHVAATQRAAIAGPQAEKTAFLTAERSSGNPSSRHAASSTAAGSTPSAGQDTADSGGVVSGRRDSTSGSSTEHVFLNHEPNFWGVMLSPRKSLRVINRD